MAECMRIDNTGIFERKLKTSRNSYDKSKLTVAPALSPFLRIHFKFKSFLVVGYESRYSWIQFQILLDRHPWD